jgi:hypothetical protein
MACVVLSLALATHAVPRRVLLVPSPRSLCHVAPATPLFARRVVRPTLQFGAPR